MEAKDKAKELVEKFKAHAHEFNKGDYDYGEFHAKACALICVDEILYTYLDMPVVNTMRAWRKDKADYWQTVKQEINKM